MSKVSFSTLFAEDNKSVLSTFTFQNEAMQAALTKAKEAKTQRVAENAAKLFEGVETHNNALLEDLRRIRKQEKAAKEKLDNFKEAVQHFLETGNFGPLYPYMPQQVRNVCASLGVDVPTVEEQKVPAKSTLS